MAKVIWSDEALASLAAIHDYIANDNPHAAVNTIEGIYRKTELLINHPYLGFVHQDEEADETRILVYGHYRILYETDGERVGIMGVFHAAREVDP